MKQLFKILSLSLILVATVTSCKKDENQIILEDAKNPVFASTASGTIVLDIANKDAVFSTFSWTNPNYKFTTGVSSQDVTYAIQVDTANANFNSSKLQEVVISKDLSKTFTVKEFNTLVAKLGLAENVAKPIDVRIKASISNSVPVYSNVIKFTITPYLDVVYPVPANLFVTGGATPLSWQCGCATDGPGTTQRFTKIGSTTFELNIVLSAGQSYLLLPQYGSWSAKYGGVGANNSNNVNGDDFKPNGSDLLAPAVTKSYKITVEFKTGKFTVQ
jgi:starch-binding outer membrane protein SusE/F